MDFWNIHVQALLVWRKRQQVTKFISDDRSFLGSLFSSLLSYQFHKVILIIYMGKNFSVLELDVIRLPSACYFHVHFWQR